MGLLLPYADADHEIRIETRKTPYAVANASLPNESHPLQLDSSLLGLMSGGFAQSRQPNIVGTSNSFSYPRIVHMV
ncbi:hypothetical protein W02_17790 [Nitrospira sp. KM1]|nr:hypothetical protein W02_17790 [Nitrospira sp. KM1]